MDSRDTPVDCPPATRLQKLLKIAELVPGFLLFVLAFAFFFTLVTIRVTAVGFFCVIAFDAGYHRSAKTLNETVRVGYIAMYASVGGGILLGFAVGLVVAAALIVNRLLYIRPLRLYLTEVFRRCDSKHTDALMYSFCLSAGRTKPIRPFVALGALAGIASISFGLATHTCEFEDGGDNVVTDAPMRSVVLAFVGAAVLGCWTWFSKEKQEETAASEVDALQAEVDNSVNGKLV